jgi:hypothetical protein
MVRIEVEFVVDDERTSLIGQIYRAHGFAVRDDYLLIGLVWAIKLDRVRKFTVSDMDEMANEIHLSRVFQAAVAVSDAFDCVEALFAQESER